MQWLDINQSLTFLTGKDGRRSAYSTVMPVLARSSNIFMRAQLEDGERIYRYVRGKDIISVIGFGELRAPDKHPAKRLEQMAGNAFNGPQLAAVLTSVVVGFGS